MEKLLILFVLLNFNAHSKLLDKTIAIINDEVITLSQVKRVQSNILARKTIAPNIYSKSSMTLKEIVEITIQKFLIRDKLTELGYIISDDQVEGQIKNTESRLGLSRKQLLQFLKSNLITFDEYFELTRESIEFSIFMQRIITPLISVTEQEVKNEFYKENASNKTLAFKYNLVDFTIPIGDIKQSELSSFQKDLFILQQTGTTSRSYQNLDTTVLGNITEDGLTKALRNLLKSTEEGKFSKPIAMNGKYHVFYIKKKDLVESSLYLSNKKRIEANLYQIQIEKMVGLWHKREKTKYYIKTFVE